MTFKPESACGFWESQKDDVLKSLFNDKNFKKTTLIQPISLTLKKLKKIAKKRPLTQKKTKIFACPCTFFSFIFSSSTERNVACQKRQPRNLVPVLAAFCRLASMPAL
jgi:hypothetical protein